MADNNTQENSVRSSESNINMTSTNGDTAASSLELFDQMAAKIIQQQESIIGPVAVDQARLVDALKIDWPNHAVSIEGSPQIAINKLVAQYKELFGQLAVESCKQAVSRLLSQIPQNLQPSSLT